MNIAQMLDKTQDDLRKEAFSLLARSIYGSQWSWSSESRFFLERLYSALPSMSDIATTNDDNLLGNMKKHWNHFVFTGERGFLFVFRWNRGRDGVQTYKASIVDRSHIDLAARVCRGEDELFSWIKENWL